MKRMIRTSKRGVSLVEEICAVFLLVIGVFAAVAAIGMARTSVSTDSVKESAAATAQNLADSLMAELSQKSAVPASIDYDAANPGKPVTVGGVKAVNVGGAEQFDSSAAANRFSIRTELDSAGGSAAGYDIVCRVYYNGGKNYAQMKAYASASGNTDAQGG